MTRAEEAALNAYPKKPSVSGVSMLGNNDRDDFNFQRDIFQRGYEKAEKDIIELSANWIYDNFRKYGNRNDLVEAFREEMKKKL